MFLDLSNNQITTLPSEIAKLRIGYLNLGNNPIINLPQEVDNMKAIRYTEWGPSIECTWNAAKDYSG